MLVNCSSCEYEIKIPDKKVPEGKAFNVSCPKCKNKVRVDGHLKKDPEPEQEPIAVEVPQKADDNESEIDTGLVVDSEFEEEEIPFYGENDKVALVLVDKEQDSWIKTLEKMDFKIQIAKSPEQAAHKMKFTQFHFVVLSETFERKNLEENEGYKFIIEMPMSTRRKMFVAMMGPNFKSGHNMQAFACSVNLVVNEQDLAKLLDLLKQAIIENDTFYKVFKETLTALGKI
jgi:hypothetical protein